VEFYYAVENRNPKNRFWRSAAGRLSEGVWRASLPILDVNQPLFAYANVHYASGICLGTSLLTTTPAALGRVMATDAHSLLIDDFAQGIGDWVTRSPATDPIPPVPSLLRAAKGPDGQPGITVTRAIPILTHKVGDPKWRGPDGAALQLQVFVRTARELKIVLHEEDFTRHWKQFTARVTLQPGQAWQTLTLGAEDFQTDKGEKPANWRKVNLLEINSAGGPGEEPVYGLMRWTK